MKNILDYGALADGKTVNTKAIQSAIDDCAKCGGTVVVPEGTFVTGSLFLKSNVELHLSHGAVLKASGDFADYNELSAYEQNYDCLAEEWVGKHLIMAIECENVAITGTGVIDGNAEAFYDEPKFLSNYVWRDGLALSKDKQNLRPGQLVCFIECKHVCVRDVTMQNATCWSCFLHGCEYGSIRGLKVINPTCAANTDGIDIDCCKHVTVSDCIINTGDDAIAIRCSAARLKNKRACEFVTVTGCVVSSASSAFRIGVGYGEIRNISVSNVVIESSGTAINFMTSFANKGEAHIEGVHFSNIVATDTSWGLEMFAGVGSIKKVVLDNCRFESCACIKLIGKEHISDVRLSNVDIYNKKEQRELTQRDIAERGRVMVWAEDMENLTLRNVNVYPDTMESWDSVFGCRNVKTLVVESSNLQ